MSILHDVVRAVDTYTKSTHGEVRRARTDEATRKSVLDRWQAARSRIGTVTTPTGITLPRLALPELDDPGEIARWLHEQGLPGEFPFVNSIYPEMYLDAVDEAGGAPAPGAPMPTDGNGAPSKRARARRGVVAS